LVKTRLKTYCRLLVGSRVALLSQDVTEAANDGPEKGQMYGLALHGFACEIGHGWVLVMPLKAGCLNVDTCCALLIGHLIRCFVCRRQLLRGRPASMTEFLKSDYK
jgi:hypothetical protein